MKAGNTLIFEGAGWEGAESSIKSGVGNCRIRTRIRNKEGRLIYLEMSGTEVTKKSSPILKDYKIAGYIACCCFDDSYWDKRRGYSDKTSEFAKTHFEYNNENILRLVNKNLNCNFTEVKVINEGLRVFDTDDELCSCAEDGYIPFREKEFNIDLLKNVKPAQKFDRDKCAKYALSYKFVSSLPFMKIYIKEIGEEGKKKLKVYNYIAILRWDKTGKIIDAEITAVQNFASFGIGLADLGKVINELAA